MHASGYVELSLQQQKTITYHVYGSRITYLELSLQQQKTITYHVFGSRITYLELSLQQQKTVTLLTLHGPLYIRTHHNMLGTNHNTYLRKGCRRNLACST